MPAARPAWRTNHDVAYSMCCCMHSASLTVAVHSAGPASSPAHQYTQPCGCPAGDVDPQNPFLAPEDAATAAPVQQEPMEVARLQQTEPDTPAPKQEEATPASHLQQQHSGPAADVEQQPLEAVSGAPAEQASLKDQAKYAAGASMSATQVATLVFWVVAITGWTGFQVGNRHSDGLRCLNSHTCAWMRHVVCVWRGGGARARSVYQTS
jgi:hypothetical protein